MEIARAGAIRLLRQPARLLGLPDVDRHGHHLAAVVFLEPGDDDRGVEAAAVCQCDFLDGHAAFSRIALHTCSSAAMNSMNAFFGVTYGGRSRRTFSRAVTTTYPFASSSCAIDFAGRLNSTPHMKPAPRTSTIDGTRAC